MSEIAFGAPWSERDCRCIGFRRLISPSNMSPVTKRPCELFIVVRSSEAVKVGKVFFFFLALCEPFSACDGSRRGALSGR